MEKTLKEKFDNINLETLPNDAIRYEIRGIQEKTSDFTDDDALDIFSKAFIYLYSRIEKNHPDCLKDYVAPAPPQPTPEEIEAKRVAQEAEEKRIAKIKKAEELAKKYKKKTAEV